MNLTHYAHLGEDIYRCVLPSGLTVVVNPRPGFRKKCAYLVIGYGSIHRSFTLDGKLCTLPTGTAHYLEHKMFDLPGSRDVTAEFAALGASPNAFTSYDMTAYHFSCTDHFQENLELLLELVATPYFTEETVEKERSIITQEILMYEDQPDSKVFDDMLSGLYHSHPIRENIAGTVESIGDITPALLHTAYRAFYRPENMVLCVCADADPEEVARVAGKWLQPLPKAEVLPAQLPPEPMEALRSRTLRQMDVAMPTFQLGFKCPAGRKSGEFARWELTAELAVEALMGESSALYLQLYREGLIDSSFGAGVETLQGCAMVTCGGDSDDPEAVRDAILTRAKAIQAEGIDPKTLERLKRSAYGSRVKALDSFESTCFRLGAYHFEDWDYLRFREPFDSVTGEALLAFIADTFRESSCTLSIIYPNG